MKNADTLYVVADGGRARFIRFTEHHQFRTIRAIESEHIHDRCRATICCPAGVVITTRIWPSSSR
jgi:hypothetical protein